MQISLLKKSQKERRTQEASKAHRLDFLSTLDFIIVIN